MTNRKFHMNFEYDPKVSLGQIVELITLMLLGISVYVSLTNTDIRHDERIATLTSEVVRIETERKYSMVETKADLKEIKASIQGLDKAVSEIAGAVRQRK